MQPYLATIICFAIFTNHDFQSAQAAVGECNFEKYYTGCYSQANFVCDAETKLCKCHPDSPVLIEQRICVKRAKLNEICQYNEQCDNSNGLYCSYSDHRLVNSSHSSSDLTRGLREPGPRCRSLKARHKHKQTSSSSSQASPNKQNQNSNPVNSNFSRLVWLFLLASLLGLFVLLLLIKSQHYRMRRSFQQEDRLSINSEQLDIPPPYEIAIRMKL